MPPEDLEEDWQTLGRPSPLQRDLRRAKERSMGFLGFLFTWAGKAWTAIWKTVFSEGLRFLLLTLAGITAAGYVGWNMTRADGKIDYCRVVRNSRNDSYKLEGHRPWREDKILMESNVREVLLKAAKEDYHCEIH